MSAFNEISVFTPEEEGRYLQQWLPLVKQIVRQFSAQADAVLGRDDLEQVALLGLLESIRRYGQPDEYFSAYARQRIRGAILDQLRQHDWRPRSLRQKSHRMNDAVRELARSLGREPNEEDIRLHLAIDAEEVQQYFLVKNAAAMESLDDLFAAGESSDLLAGRDLDDQMTIQRTLQKALAALEPREQLILSLYYQQDMSLKEIALVLELTEARVCQLNKKIADKIKLFFE
ncbi:RNA polymerase, sigma 28 subunit, SigD/FliA/WhiG [Izhakiella capsodis]|uniref:RNA polymerase, sigma 28 subunit, SigD/FliA/WhiG n=1 Tax=Izhakiella capsodis TaxID=1367852 RepID=A0A1I5B0L5_9GAMM|nr:FliA/WhiG family RNA polymerase sigma factor [Izhakiella capsodis]SFN68243.1 RNA polymerase, sigma 28 subunit, SigD/FliA/WhiG [Izhakiella capsodis]